MRTRRPAFSTVLSVSLMALLTALGVDSGMARPPDHVDVAATCGVLDDYLDPDDDGLTSCLETHLMHTAPLVTDTDSDGIKDGFDLVRQKPAGDIPIEIKILTIREVTKKCDVKGTRYWDPYLSTAFIAIPTLEEEGRIGHFEKNGFTKGSHKHDKKTIEPESLLATIQIPENIALYDVSDVLSIPHLSLKLGLYDHDLLFHDEVDMGISTDGVDLPITLTLNGEFITRSFLGTDDSCSGRIDVQVQTPLSFDAVLASVIAKLHVGSGENGAASLSDMYEHSKRLIYPDGTAHNELDVVSSYPGHNVEQVVTLGEDAGEYLNPAHHDDHILWHFMPDGDLSGHVSTECSSIAGWSNVAFSAKTENGTMRAVLFDNQGRAVSETVFNVSDVNGFYLPPLEWCRGAPAGINITLSPGTPEAVSREYTFTSQAPSVLTETQGLVVLTDDEAVLGWQPGWLWDHV